jgi:hypothetical protein
MTPAARVPIARGARAAALALLVAAATILGAGAPAAAHQRPPTARAAPAPPLAGGPLAPEPAGPLSPALAPVAAESAPPVSPALALLGLLAVVLVGVQSRRAVALGLVLLSGPMAFESGVHSVHHLDSPRDMSECAVAAAATHVQGTVEAAPPALAQLEWVGLALPVQETRPASALAWPPGRGRAPPPVLPA